MNDRAQSLHRLMIAGFIVLFFVLFFGVFGAGDKGEEQTEGKQKQEDFFHGVSPWRRLFILHEKYIIKKQKGQAPCSFCIKKQTPEGVCFQRICF